MKQGQKVKLIRQSSSHLTGRKPVRVGTIGEILATRKLPGDEGKCLLVKFQGHGTPRHTPAEDVSLI